MLGGRFPDAWRIAVSGKVMFASSRPVTVSRRLTGVPTDSWRMHRSPPDQGRPPLARAVMATSQSMAAIGVVPSLMLVPWPVNRVVRSSRRRNVPPVELAAPG
jgi:hypothetical protein